MTEVASLKIELDKLAIDEFEYLEWFRINADFGPAHSDVIAIMDAHFEEETGRPVPIVWREEEDDE